MTESPIGQAILDAIADLKSTMDQRFAVVDQRFEVVDERFVAMEQRFETVAQRLSAIESSTSALTNVDLSFLQVAARTQQRAWTETNATLRQVETKLDELYGHMATGPEIARLRDDIQQRHRA